jgi:hypothetical protein
MEFIKYKYITIMQFWSCKRKISNKFKLLKKTGKYLILLCNICILNFTKICHFIKKCHFKRYSWTSNSLINFLFNQMIQFIWLDSILIRLFYIELHRNNLVVSCAFSNSVHLSSIWVTKYKEINTKPSK